MDSYDTEQRPTWWRRNRSTVIWLTLILIVAGVTRVAFNYGPATNDGTYRYAGNDDYYHYRVVEQVQLSGDHLVEDPLLNYPAPAKNPRPPLYDWHVAIFGQLLGFVSGEAAPGEPAMRSGMYALEWGSAFWGILTVIPIWLIGRAVFGNRAGLWAAFLLAASPAHIQRSGFGLGDHDAFLVFFLVLGAYFLVRALQLTRDDVRVASWSRPGSVAGGLGEYILAHGEGLAYAVLTGVCWAAIALAWEGYPYVLAVYAVYYVLQLLSNQIRRRDSTGDLLVYVTIVGINLAYTIPFYWIHGNVGSTLHSTNYLLVILGVLSLFLIPTRDLPAILVLPGIVATAFVGIGFLSLFLPDVLRQLSTANGYFVQSRLYSTIAEAQRTELGVFVFSIGFMTFFFALIGFVQATVRYFKTKDRALWFLVGWGLISIYMGFAATRFVFNAAPIFAVLGGWVTARIITWMNFRERLKNFSSLRQDGFFKATRSTMGAKQIAGSLFLLLFLVVPNLWFSVDAGLPSEARLNYRSNHPDAASLIDKRTGAFGQGFLDDDWIKVYGWLDQQDRDLPESQRPAHIAWWDYGFWEVAISHHPTVADNFQNGHQLAGRFLAAQSETEAINWLSIRLLEGNYWHGGRAFEADVEQALAKRDANWSAQLTPLVAGRYDEAMAVINQGVTSLDEAVSLYDELRVVTGRSIEYFLVDGRMFPYDNPQTGQIDSGSIFYAPVFLANQNPDDFVQTIYVDTQGTEYAVQAYRKDSDGNVVQERPPKIVDEGGRCFFVSGPEVFRATANCKLIDYSFNAGKGVELARTGLKFKDAYYNTMFYKGFVGGDKPAQGDYPPTVFEQVAGGEGLRHFRFVYGTGFPDAVKLLQYYSGAEVTGTARLENGASLAGYTIEAQDPFNVTHSTAVIGSDGSFVLRDVPFSLPDESGVKIVITQGGAEIANQTIQISKQDANARKSFQVTITVRPGTLDGFVYADNDGNGAFDAANDTALAGAVATIDGRDVTTGADGRFRADNVLPGSKTVMARKAGYENGTATTNLPEGATANVSIGLKVAPVKVSGTLKNAAGAALEAAEVTFTAQDMTKGARNATATTDTDGNFTADLQPVGKYTVAVDHTTTEDNKTVHYRGETVIDVAFNGAPMRVTIALTRTEE